MPVSVVVNQRREKAVAFMTSPQQEVMPPLELLRFLKGQFPEEYKVIWYEPVVPDHRGLILPGGLNGRGPVRDEGHTGDGAGPSGDTPASGEIGPGDVS